MRKRRYDDYQVAVLGHKRRRDQHLVYRDQRCRRQLAGVHPAQPPVPSPSTALSWTGLRVTQLDADPRRPDPEPPSSGSTPPRRPTSSRSTGTSSGSMSGSRARRSARTRGQLSLATTRNANPASTLPPSQSPSSLELRHRLRRRDQRRSPRRRTHAEADTASDYVDANPRSTKPRPACADGDEQPQRNAWTTATGASVPAPPSQPFGSPSTGDAGGAGSSPLGERSHVIVLCPTATADEIWTLASSRRR